MAFFRRKRAPKWQIRILKHPKNEKVSQKRPKTAKNVRKNEIINFSKTTYLAQKAIFWRKKGKKCQNRILKHPKNEKVSQKRQKSTKNVRKNEIIDFSETTYLAQKAIFWRKKGKKMSESDFKTPQK